MTDDELLRYSRHLLLNEIGTDGQQRLHDAHVLVIGVGGLGSPAVLYLASAGVGHVVLLDHDVVDLTNLQRQIAHTQERIGQPKVLSAARAMREINPQVQITTLQLRANADLLDRQVAQVDVVLDCCDNFATRQAINAACVRHHKPLVSGAAIGFDGQLTLYDPRQPACPCYACVFAPQQVPEEVNCANLGVFAPVVGMIGTLQAAEALKLLAAAPGSTRSLAGRLLMLDGRAMEWTEIAVRRRPDCPVCKAPQPA